MKIKQKLTNRIIKQAQKGFRGFPVATVAYYGPDDQRASKVAVGIIKFEGAEPIMRRWFTDTTDARLDEKITNEIVAYIKSYNARSVASVAKLLGCPHEEAIDYPEGEVCPHCPFWANKDRWEGVVDEHLNS
ncbi:MAG: hypothetical protein J2P31_02405 [Blastocatellia bacterium]|nr:hypothetical protein [Blastocatellia bacterium]